MTPAPGARAGAAALLLAALALLSGARCERGAAEMVDAGGVYTVSGVLTGEGVECPALRTDSGKVFTLSGALGEFTRGDRVCVRGRPAEMSTCQQGVTLAVEWIGPDCAGAPAASKRTVPAGAPETR